MEINATFLEMRKDPTRYFSSEALKETSPKFLVLLSKIQNSKKESRHLIHSQFHKMEGLDFFSQVLEANGYSRFEIRKNASGRWVWEENTEQFGKPRYIFFTDRESQEERNLLYYIYNSKWKNLPESLQKKLKQIAHNNTRGQIIQIVLTSSPCFINSTKKWQPVDYIHIMEPSYYPFHIQNLLAHFDSETEKMEIEIEIEIEMKIKMEEQEKEQEKQSSESKNTKLLQVFFYLMKLTKEQEKQIQNVSDDLSKISPYETIVTTDEWLYQISELKTKINKELLTLLI